MKINFHDIHTQYITYKDEINANIQKVLDSCQFIMGKEVSEFEKSLAAYGNCKYAITCASGTDALLLSMMAIDLKPGDEVITTPFTFVATAEVISLLGARPVFADIQHDTYNIDPTKIADKINAKTRAIIPVSLYGQPADIDEINDLAEYHGNMIGNKIYVIEDAAQSFGAKYKNKKSGNLCDIGCVSFFPSKPLGCYGDGGAVMTNDADLAARMQSLRLHGQTKRYHHKYIGYNSRLDTIQAAILQVKLKYFDNEIKKRETIAANYNKLLHDMDLILPQVKHDRSSVYAQYSIRVRDRENIIQYLTTKNVPTAVHYPLPLHMQECFKYLGYGHGDFPVAETIAAEILSLPMSAFLNEIQQSYVAEALNDILSTYIPEKKFQFLNAV